MPAGRPAPVVAAHPLRSAACHRCHPHFYTAISRAKLQGGTRKVSKKNFYRFSAFWLRSKEYFENAFGLAGWLGSHGGSPNQGAADIRRSKVVWPGRPNLRVVGWGRRREGPNLTHERYTDFLIPVLT